MTELAIPDESERALFTSGAVWVDDEDRDFTIRAIAAPVVAGELRRLANLVIADDTVDDIVDLLDARADELDGGTQ